MGISLLFFSCQAVSDQHESTNKNHSSVKVIFDTDIAPDYDDIGAMAVLHALADNGEAEILATVASNSHPSVAPIIELYNTYYRRTAIPIGMANSTAPNMPATNYWNDTLINRYNPSLANKQYESALKVYRKVLSAQPDNSVTIITVGFMSNISDLLKSQPDEFSTLSGKELINKKVKNWVAMAGLFPQGIEFNVIQDSIAATYAFQHFPKPILFSGFEIGDKIMTGGKTAQLNDINNLVSEGYKYNFETYDRNQKVANRNSWDQTTVLVAIRDPEDYFYLSGPGTFIAHANGSNEWEPREDGLHRFLIHKYPYRVVEKVIEDLMIAPPKVSK